MSETVVIKWRRISYSMLPEVEDTYFYAFSRGSNLLYLGIAYDQNVKREIRNEMREFGLDAKGLTIWVGYIDYVKTTYKRITRKIIEDVECLLIYTHKPRKNTQCTASYTRRENLRVKNYRCPYLRRCVRVEDGKVYKSC